MQNLLPHNVRVFPIIPFVLSAIYAQSSVGTHVSLSFLGVLYLAVAGSRSAITLSAGIVYGDIRNGY